mmetsp:Transcript_22704/g.16085  ORF Transcript_22704/g.16085 Transcript_22704/m.16085 type:complete len:205 (+) Transcript_22704:27-641(+)
MINGLQYFVHMPVMGVSFPANCQMVMTPLISVATFDIVTSDQAFGWLFTFPPEEPYTINFDSVGYSSRYTIQNMNTSFVMLVVFLVIIAIMILMIPCKFYNERIDRVFLGILNWCFWNPVLRFLIESCLEVSIALFINFKDHRHEVSASIKANNLFSFTLACLLGALPLFIMIFYSLKTDEFENKGFEHKWGAVYDGMVLKDKR